jgi:MFS family permease
MSKTGSSYAILRNLNFRHLALARFLFSFAFQLQAVVVGWQVYEIRKDPLYLGLIGLAEAVPAISLALFGGHVVDRGSPLKIYRLMMVLAWVCTLMLWFSSTGWIPLTPDAHVAVIFGVVFISGIVRAFAWPAMFAFTPQIVEREWLAVATTWMSSVFQIAAVTGPALGGILYAWRGASAAYALTSFLVLLTIVALSRIQSAHLAPKPKSINKEPILESLASGVKFVFSNQVVLGALSLDMFAVLFGGATALLPIFAGDILNLTAMDTRRDAGPRIGGQYDLYRFFE